MTGPHWLLDPRECFFDSREPCRRWVGMKAASPSTVSSVRPGRELGARARTAAGGRSMEGRAVVLKECAME